MTNACKIFERKQFEDFNASPTFNLCVLEQNVARIEIMSAAGSRDELLEGGGGWRGSAIGRMRPFWCEECLFAQQADNSLALHQKGASILKGSL